ncbi:MAG: RrF2 family transcriptional regulator [Bacillus sp. (in: firmicutes)]
MKLTTFSDYSIRVLLYLAANEGKMSSIQEIADSYQISKNHLMKVIYQLGKKGYIETLRGRNGGIRLGLKPEEINIGKLVRDTEEDFHIAECFSPDHETCPIRSFCAMKGVLNHALQAFMNVLDSYTLEDVTKNKVMLKQMLSKQETKKTNSNGN